MAAFPHPDPPLTDGAVLLRGTRPEDAPAITAACRDPEIPRWTNVPANYSIGHARDFIARSWEQAARGEALSLLAVDPGDGRLLGCVGLSTGGPYGPEVGYWVASEARGRGVASRALGLFRDWAPAALGFHRLVLRAHEDNVRSRRVAVATGFTDTGQRVTGPHRGPNAEFILYAWERSSA